ncbi:MAG: hypothetical protein JNM53_02360 [Gemmatimonadetes bacterium]|nr:hypothetical protein [Gemmatimonadota bacterium]
MRPIAVPLSPVPPRDEVAIRVADALADAVAQGPGAALRTARRLTDEELRLGLDFVSTVLEVASGSARAMAAVLAERTGSGVH